MERNEKGFRVASSFHRVLKGTGAKEGFLARIELPSHDRETLTTAREDIRRCLREAFQRAGDAEPLRKAFLVEGAPIVYAQAGFLAGFRPVPRFASQGSYSYRTLNDPVPEHTPPQQVDIDDGVFLPTSFVNEEKPVFAAKAYFKVVEDALRPFCRAKGWTLCEGKKAKDSCVRVLVNGKIHIDLPLYAIPDDDYAEADKLEKAMQARGEVVLDAAFAEAAYQRLPEDHIMLAKRDGSWQRSDPRKLANWFEAAVRRHQGPHLRHVCRYLKAWRDLTWEEPGDGIPSITLMAFAVRAFHENRTRLDANREDDALLAVAERMPDYLKARVPNPVVEGEYLDDGWSDAKRQVFVKAAETLRDHLKAARDATRADAVLSRLTGCLGDRVPQDLDLVQVLPTEELAVLSQAPQRVAAPAVGRHVSG
jgi:hypothetical protein